MNDDQLGRAVRTALTAPELRAAPGAGATLRARARRERGRRAAAGLAAAGVVAVLAVGLVRWVPESAPTAAAPAPAPAPGLTLLTTPVTVGPVGACREDAGTACTTAFPLTVDEVRSVRAEDGTVVLDLTADDAATLAGITGGGPGTPLDLRVGPGRPLRAELDEGRVLVPLADPGAAAATVAGLEPYRAGSVRAGPGPLTVPLELWSVEAATAGPCTRTSAGAGTRVVDRRGQCQVLRGPGVRIRSADLQVVAPDDTNTLWRVRVGLPARDRAGLEAWTRTQVDKPIAFVAGRALVGGSPLLASALSEGFEIGVEDRVTAEALVIRLRP